MKWILDHWLSSSQEMWKSNGSRSNRQNFLKDGRDMASDSEILQTYGAIAYQSTWEEIYLVCWRNRLVGWWTQNCGHWQDTPLPPTPAPEPMVLNGCVSTVSFLFSTDMVSTLLSYFGPPNFRYSMTAANKGTLEAISLAYIKILFLSLGYWNCFLCW